MAHLSASGQNNILKIREFLGLNENPDGDTHLRNGEMSRILNFRVTRDRHLQLRPGQRTVTDIAAAWEQLGIVLKYPDTARTDGVWSGMAGGAQHVLASYGAVIWEVSPDGSALRQVGSCHAGEASFFGFNNKVYLLNGRDYMSWDGDPAHSFQKVEGYIPTVYTACTPEGDGTLLESVNRLTGKRRVKFSPDGTATVFHLPEQSVDEIVSVQGTDIACTADSAAGTLTFSSAPPAGTNTISAVYRKGSGTRGDVESMHFAELFNGSTDARVFLYGNGTNKTIYSGMDLDTGLPSAEYFPDLSEALIGDENTPITAMVRHYSRLLVFKSDSAWSIEQGMVSNALGGVTTTFSVLPVNRQLGNEAPGQVRLLENNPLSLAERNIYQWTAASVGVNAASDIRNAGRISDRVLSTLAGFDLSRTVTFNRTRESEFWFLYGGKALILNYAADAWYVYDNMPFKAMIEADGEVYGFTEDGLVRHVSAQYRNDGGEEIRAEAETGAMDFDRDWLLKYSPQLFVAIRPESGARVCVSVETNRRGDYPEKTVSAGLAGFNHVDFGHFSFGTNRKPQVRRVKLKVKKATFYKLVFRSKSASSTVTLLETDIQLRYAGNVK